MSKKKWTQSQKDYVETAMSFGCVVSGQTHDIEWHHMRVFGSGGQKSVHSLGFPLSIHHHRTGGWGEAIHASQADFEAKYGTEAELYEKSNFKVLGW